MAVSLSGEFQLHYVPWRFFPKMPTVKIFFTLSFYLSLTLLEKHRSRAGLFGVTPMHMQQGGKKILALFMGLIGKCIRLNFKKCIMDEQFQLVAKLQG
jgi:hypothetical protein